MLTRKPEFLKGAKQVGVATISMNLDAAGSSLILTRETSLIIVKEVVMPQPGVPVAGQSESEH